MDWRAIRHIGSLVLGLGLAIGCSLCVKAAPISVNTTSTGRLDHHQGVMSSNVLAYTDSGLSNSANHYICAGDWFDGLSNTGSVITVKYPLTIQVESTSSVYGQAVVNASQYYFNSGNFIGAENTAQPSSLSQLSGTPTGNGWFGPKWSNNWVNPSGSFYCTVAPLGLEDNLNNDPSCMGIQNLTSKNMIARANAATMPYYAGADQADEDHTFSGSNAGMSTAQASFADGSNTISLCSYNTSSGAYNLGNATLNWDSVSPSYSGDSVNTSSDGKTFTVEIDGITDSESGVADQSGNSSTSGIVLSAEGQTLYPTKSSTISQTFTWDGKATTCSVTLRDRTNNTTTFRVNIPAYTGSSGTSSGGSGGGTSTGGGSSGGSSGSGSDTPAPDTTPPTMMFVPPSCTWRNTPCPVSIIVNDPSNGTDTVSGVASFSYYGSNSLGNYAPSGSGGAGGGSCLVSGEGVTYLYGTVTDGAGNTGSAFGGPYMIDYTAPSVMFSPNGDPISVRSQNVGISVSDTLSGISSYSVQTSSNAGHDWTTVRSVSGLNGSYSANTSVNLTTIGAWFIKVTTTDMVGNTQTVMSNVYLIDPNPPTISLVNGQDFLSSVFSTFARWTESSDSTVNFGDPTITTADDAIKKGLYNGITAQYTINCQEANILLCGTLKMMGASSGEHDFPLHFGSVDGPVQFVPNTTGTYKAYAYVPSTLFSQSETIQAITDFQDWLPCWTSGYLTDQQHIEGTVGSDATPPQYVTLSQNGTSIIYTGLSDNLTRAKYVQYQLQYSDGESVGPKKLLTIPNGTTNYTLPEIDESGTFQVALTLYDAVMVPTSEQSLQVTLSGLELEGTDVPSAFSDAWYIGIRHPVFSQFSSSILKFLNGL